MWHRRVPPNVAALTKDVLQGVGRAGMGYNNNKWRELVVLIAAIHALKKMPPIERAAIVNEPMKFSSWLETFALGQNRQLPHILTFLLFPDHFERISTARNKRDILVAYGRASAKDIKAWTRQQLDQGLFELRKGLEAEHGSRVDFYEGQFGEKWREPKAAKQSKTLSAPSIGDDDEDPQIELAQSGHQSQFELNTIFYGPPGTGKTFYTSHRAVLICNGIADDDREKLRESYEALRKASRIAFVTFHQSYTYEDFVEGMRPKANGAGFTLEPEDGILLRMAKAAIANPQKNYVLIIDEINRANVAKVLGELITLLEADKRINGKDMVPTRL